MKYLYFIINHLLNGISSAFREMFFHFLFSFTFFLRGFEDFTVLSWVFFLSTSTLLLDKWSCEAATILSSLKRGCLYVNIGECLLRLSGLK